MTMSSCRNASISHAFSVVFAFGITHISRLFLTIPNCGTPLTSNWNEIEYIEIRRAELLDAELSKEVTAIVGNNSRVAVFVL